MFMYPVITLIYIPGIAKNVIVQSSCFVNSRPDNFVTSKEISIIHIITAGTPNPRLCHFKFSVDAID